MKVRAAALILLLILILLALAIFLTPAEAQHGGKIGFLCEDSCSTLPNTVGAEDQAFLKGLEQAGYALGRNASLNTAGIGVGHDRLAEVAKRLSSKVDVIVAVGNAAARAARQATRTTPIVMVGVADPIEEKLIVSLGRPGGNVTGLGVPFEQLATKHIELLKEIHPGLARVAVLWSPVIELHRQRLGRLEAAARPLGVQVLPVEVADVRDLEKAFNALTRQGPDGLLALEHLLGRVARGRVALFALQHRLPTVASDRVFVSAGGLLTYGPDLRDQYERAAIYVGKILKGAKPSELPVEEPTRFELVINTATAKALGLTIPPSLLLRADQVME